jgi:hypothetical protein
MSGPLDFLRERPEEISSWPYWAQWATPAVRFRYWALTAASVLFCAVLICVSNPNLIFNWGWNTIDYISSPFPLPELLPDGAAAIAQSNQWLALAATKNGVTILNADSRVVVHSDKGAALDVTAGPAEGSFYTLERGERSGSAIVLTRHENMGWTREIQLEAPLSPTWKVPQKLKADDIMFAELDDTGLFLAARGAGAARNRFVPVGGANLRTRDWQSSEDLSSARLREIRGVNGGYWLVLNSGQVRFVDRAGLRNVPERAAPFTLEGKLSVSKDGDWATAIDEHRAAWYYKKPVGWSGPWFTTEGARLNSAQEIIGTRLLNGKLWLAGSKGLFVYDEARRSFRSLLANTAVNSLEPTGGGVLAAADSGLYYFPSTSSTGVRLDEARAGKLSLSPSGDSAVYQADASLPRGIALPPPLGERPAIFGAEKWDAGEKAPKLRGAAQIGESVLLASDVGCLIYNVNGPSYRDCSSAISNVPARRNIRIRSFDHLLEQDKVLLASGDGYWMALDRSYSWTVIDPNEQIRSLHVTSVSGKIFGANAEGIIARFAEDGLPDRTYPDRKYGALAPQHTVGAPTASLNASEAPHSLRGDLMGSPDDWRLLIVEPSRLLEYRSAWGVWRQWAVAARQATLFADGVAWVTPRGSLFADTATNGLFGNGALPFNPSKATALAASRDGRSVFVGGPNGAMALYHFGLGSWEMIPALPQHNVAVEIEDWPDGLWARSASGEVYRLKEQWMHEDATVRWTRSADGVRWQLTNGGVSAAFAKASQSPQEQTFSNGDGGGRRSAHHRTKPSQIADTRLAHHCRDQGLPGVALARTLVSAKS